MQNHKQLVGFIAPQQLLVADFGSSQARSLQRKDNTIILMCKNSWFPISPPICGNGIIPPWGGQSWEWSNWKFFTSHKRYIPIYQEWPRRFGEMKIPHEWHSRRWEFFLTTNALSWVENWKVPFETGKEFPISPNYDDGITNSKHSVKTYLSLVL